MPLRREDVVMKKVLRHNFVPPPAISSAAQDLITTKLLHPEPPDAPRLPVRRDIDVQDHKWFAGDPQSYTQLAEFVDFVGISGCTAPPAALPSSPWLIHN